jgi:signal peptidase
MGPSPTAPSIPVNTLSRLATLGLVVAWFLLLRPVALGGPAAYEIVSGHSMEPLLHTGDLVITQSSSTYVVGDLIAFHVPAAQVGSGAVVIHRIVGGDGQSGFIVKGDNKATPDTWRPKASDVIGHSWIALPGSGDVLLTLRRPTILGALAAGVFAFWFFMSDVRVPRWRPKQGSAT